MTPATPSPPTFNRVAMIGIGLINGSLAKVLKRDGLADEIVACSRREETLTRARDLGIADRTTTDPAEAVIGADLVVIGTPTGAAGTVAEAIASTLDRRAIITDVGSIKSKVIDDVLPHLPFRGRFVPGHPVAGTENSGPDAAFDTLFVGRHCILTPIAETDPDALATVRALWEAAGSRVEIMTPAHHDQVLAITSHLPHLIAYTIVGTVADLEDHLQTEVLRYSAGGFTDFTRIAGSDPVMWRDIFLHNKEAVLEMLGRFSEDLSALQRAIRWGDGETLETLFTRTRAIRRGVIAEGQAYQRRAAVSDRRLDED
ncbi:MAG: prephenate/arogenate dehydrogenase family protein [Alphaproteobacteria bacterium]|nr:prephenate/arogenate dehydrogenase family protein [Alphaproteobacteria bacterium]